MFPSKLFWVPAILLLLFRASTVISANPRNKDCDQLLEKALEEDKDLVKNYRILNLLESGLMEIHAHFHLVGDEYEEMVSIPKRLTEDFHFIFVVYNLLTASDDFKIHNEELLKHVSTLAKCPLNREVNAKMMRNQNKLSDMLPLTSDLLHTFCSSRILGVECAELEFRNPGHLDPLKCVHSSGLYDCLSSYQRNYETARRVKISAKIRMCEKHELEACYDFEFRLPSENGKVDLHEETTVMLACPLYGMKSHLLKDVIAKK